MIRAAIFLLAIASAAPVSAGQIVWRASTAGVLEITAPPPPLEVDPAPVVDFGISYGSTRVRPGTNLFISPIWSEGRPQPSYTFTSRDLPAPLSLDLSSGLIRGRIVTVGTYDFSVTISPAAGQSQTLAVTVVVE